MSLATGAGAEKQASLFGPAVSILSLFGERTSQHLLLASQRGA
jgi:hypothetical protein